MNQTPIGSDFDAFLKEEEIFEEVEKGAIKKSLAIQIADLMNEKLVNKTEMARMMKISQDLLDKILDPDNTSVTLKTMEHIAQILDA